MKIIILFFLIITPLIAMENIPQSAMTVIHVDSEEKVGENGAAANVLDGDPETIWHTEWYSQSPGYPHEIVFQLDKSYQIENFSYLPRKSQSNGRIKDYEIYISNDQDNWGDPVLTGKWPDETAQQIEDLPSPVSGQFVKLKALSEVNGNLWASAAEIKLNAELDPLTDIDGWASSLHLGFQDPSTKDAHLLMVDITVDSTSPSTYYAPINFTGGYCGLQDQGNNRTVHFSLWDYVDGDQQQVPEGAEARTLWRGHRVVGSDFGGEGTGVKTWRSYAWKTGEPYRLVVKLTPHQINQFGGAMRDYWVFNFKSQEWLHVATLWRADNPKTGKPETDLGEVYTFVEDWAATSEWYRSCYIFNARKMYMEGGWHIYDRAYYTINDRENNPVTPDKHDPNTQAEIREENKIWLATGGTFIPEDRTNSSTMLRFPPNTDFQVEAPELSTLDAEAVDDTTMTVSWDYVDELWAAQESYSIQIFQDADMQNLLYSTGTLRPFDYETNAKEQDSDRNVLLSGLKLEKDNVYYLYLQTNTIFGFSCSKKVEILNMATTVSSSQTTVPHSLKLAAAYPNPFNSKVVISYSLDMRDDVVLDIYDIRGTKIRSLFDGRQNPGHYEFQWDADDDGGVSVASGLYLYRLMVGAQALSGKITLLK
jgi:hypothetical protein